MFGRLAALALTLALIAAPAAAAPAFEDRYAQNGAVRIHYTAAGNGPLVVMIHGFGDTWHTWRSLMDTLDDDHRVVALDLRGWNLSDKPKGVEAYTYPHLIADVEAVIRAEGRKSAIVIGHDWGGGIAWRVASDRPELVERLVVISTPHPAGLTRELATNPAQQRNSEYARNFMKPGSEAALTAEGMADWVKDPALKALYVEAYRRSDFAAMMNLYRANYPKDEKDAAAKNALVLAMPNVKAPTLIVHGEADTSLLAAGHNDAWRWIDADVTLLMVPGAGHFVQYDAPALVNRTIKEWLAARP
ncbi:MAG TPA: alpha/beta hydrolase [Phenylobacterium sp.]